MGTSAGYSPPTTGNWPDFKRDLTSLATSAASGPVDSERIGRTMGRYTEAHGGAQRAAQQMASATRTGAKLGGFLSNAQQNGLSQALADEGLGHLIGQSPTRVLEGITNHLVGPGSLLEEDIVRQALLDLQLEMYSDYDTYDDLDAALSGLLEHDGVDSVMKRFFGMCIYKQFETHSTERLLQKVSGGVRVAKRLLRDIKQHIFMMLDLHTHDRDLADINWRGAEGERISQEILAGVWRVYGAE